MKIDQFDRNILNVMRTDIDKALAKVGAKHGVILTSGRATYSGSNFTMKIQASLINSDGRAMTEEASNLKLYIELDELNFKLGDTFEFKNKIYEVTGYSPRSFKFPVLAFNKNNGKTYKFPKDTVNALVKS